MKKEGKFDVVPKVKKEKKDKKVAGGPPAGKTPAAKGPPADKAKKEKK